MTYVPKEGPRNIKLNSLVLAALNICPSTKSKKISNYISLHKKSSFSLSISSVNLTKSTVFCGFGHIYLRNP